jgi:hypothetical protein
MSDPSKPHRACVWIYAEIHPVNSRGEFAGEPVRTHQRFPVQLDGTDLPLVERRLAELFALIREKCQ